MGEKKEIIVDNTNLRGIAEKKLNNCIQNLDKLPSLEIKNLLHEFQVYRVELEMQNEELRLTQQKLDETLEKYVNLFNFAPVGYLTLNENNLIEEANHTAAGLFDITIKHLKKKPITSLIIKEDIEIYYFMHKELVKSEKKQQFELRMKGKEGCVFWANITSIVNKDEGGTYKVHLTVSDVSERIQIEEQIRFQAALLNAVGQAVIATSIEGNIVYMNHAAENLYGWKLYEVTGRSIMAVVTPKISPGQKAEIMEHLKKGEPWLGEIVVHYHNEVAIPIMINYSPILDKNGALIGSVSISFNISERKRTEESLYKLNEHLQSIREEERANIAREIHDDLGQTLTALKMDLTWLKKQKQLDNKPLQNKIDVMSGMIDSTIQTVQRIATELRPGILDDLGLPAAIEWLTEEINKRTNINFELTIIPEDISFEQKLSINIYRIVQETLTNVIRHSNATIVKIKIEKFNNELNINIIDNGVGIPEEKINNINSLGLTGIRERARYWNGEVNIKGTVNKGTEVSIKLQLSNGDLV